MSTTLTPAREKALRAADRAIAGNRTVIYDVAAEHAQQVDNVKHLRWFREAVADELERK